MECNRDEAIRAREIAERKLTGKDYLGAKKFALKAQNLYPELEGLSQMSTILDVYIAAENKISGEADWYGILCVNPLADDETLKKGYRKLALALHPDKNKFTGADGAFKLVSEAWSLLSDKVKRLAYNQRRNLKGFQQKVPTQRGGPSAPFRANDFHTSTNNTTSNARTQSNTTRMSRNVAPSQSQQKTDTFWTICLHCKTQYEYLRIYLNHTLLCPNCHEPFLASERAPPTSMPKSSYWSSRQQHRSSNHHAATNNQFNPGRNASVAQNSGLGRSAGHDSYNHTYQWASSSFTNPQVTRVMEQASEKVKRERDEAQATARWEKRHTSMKMGSEIPFSNSDYFYNGEEVRMKKMRMGDDYMNNYGSNMAYGPGSAGGFSNSCFDPAKVNNFFVNNNKHHSSRELSQLEIRTMLMEKAQLDIRKKLKEWRSATEIGKEKEKEKQKGKQKRTVHADGNGLKNNVDTEKGNKAGKSFPGTSGDDTVKEPIESTPMNVPDPDFHNFDMDRTENSFGENQVWAAYDNDDGMPRYYAIIHKVMSSNPFKIKISWLNSRSNSEFGPLDWIRSGFTKTCGDFRVGRHEINKTLNSFSHKVMWTKGSRGVICIYPRKGEVWALYRNWSPDWNEDTQDEVVHKYDMVEVLDDYDEEKGVSVTPLIKVSGFRAVHRPEYKEVRRIPKEEMFRLSHQVPNYLITGEEGQNAPKGCRELDPAATPLELLQVLTDANDVPEVENDGRAEKEMLIDERMETDVQLQTKGEEGLKERSKVVREADVVENSMKIQD